MPSNIPLARQLLKELAGELEPRHSKAVEDIIARYMVRDPASRRSDPYSPHVDALMAADIRRYARANPDMPLEHIADVFGCNAGRVSEAIRGLR